MSPSTRDSRRPVSNCSMSWHLPDAEGQLGPSTCVPVVTIRIGL